MKPTLRLVLTLFVLAGSTALASLAIPADGSSGSPVALEAEAIPVPTPAGLIGSQPIGDLNCLQFCMVALCPEPQTCGPFTDASGQRRCGCHGGSGTVEAAR